MANIIENIVTTVSHIIQVLTRSSWSIDIFKRRLGFSFFVCSIYGKLFDLQCYDSLLRWEIKLVHRVYQTRQLYELLQLTLQRKIHLRFCPRQNDTNLMASFCSEALAELVT